MFEIAIINSPSPPGKTSNKDSMGGFGQLYPALAPPFPPLDLPYLAAYLAEAGLHPHILDAVAERFTPDQLTTAITKRVPKCDLLLLRTSLPTIDFDLEVAATLKRAFPGVRLGLFGPVVPSLQARIRTDRSLDFAIQGEPDAVIAELAGGKDPKTIPGLLWRSGDGWIDTGERAFERDLDKLPFPRWDLMPIENYEIPKSSTSGRVPFLPMLTSRGCPYGCSYCPYPIGQGLKWRFRSPGNVVDEMQHLVERYGVRHILFRDPMFSLNQKRVLEICDAIVARGIKVDWKCETRVDCLDPETIAAMAKAGCKGINFGVESTDPVIQKGVHRKPILPPEFTEKVELCRRHGISTFAFFIVGLPGDNVETILDSIEFGVGLRASWIQFTVATPFKGTPLHEWASSRGAITPDFYKIVSAHEGSIGNEHLEPADIQRLHRFARFLQNHLLNRHGILKNERRSGFLYRNARGLADWASLLVARTSVAWARRHFHRTVRLRSPVPAPSS